MTTLALRRRGQEDRTPQLQSGRPALLITPPINEDYWAYRVDLTERQAVVGFPKFGTIGIGFAQEEDWNTNLPYTCGAEEIRDHILDNKGDESISDDDVLAAIRLIQQAATEDGAA